MEYWLFGHSEIESVFTDMCPISVCRFRIDTPVLDQKSYYQEDVA